MVMVYSAAQRDEAEAALKTGEGPLQVAERLKIKLAVVLRWAAPLKPKLSRSERRRGGRKPLLDEADLQAMSEFVRVAPMCTVPELAAKLAEVRGKSVSGPTIVNAMKRLGLTKTPLARPPSQPAPQTPPRYGPQHRRQPEPGKYPSSLTDAEWAVVEPLLAKLRDPRGRKPSHDKRLMMDAVFYIVRTGCQWRQLPLDMPPWQAVWSTFRRYRDSGLLERLYDALHELWRAAAQRAATATAGIVDSQTVKTTEKGAFAATTPARKPRAARGIWSLTSSDCPSRS